MQDGEDLFACERGDLSRYGEPAVDVAFEGQHIGRTGALSAFAGDFVHNILGEEVLEGGVEEVGDTVFPD